MDVGEGSGIVGLCLPEVGWVFRLVCVLGRPLGFGVWLVIVVVGDPDAVFVEVGQKGGGYGDEAGLDGEMAIPGIWLESIGYMALEA